MFSVLLLLSVSSNAMPNMNATDHPIDQAENSGIPKQTTLEQIFEVKLTTNINDSTVLPITTTTMMIIPNSTITNVVIAGRVGNARSYNSTASQSSSGSQLSGGAIAGIVIGVIVLCCCLALCGCCTSKESGHWEDAKVWVKH